MDEDTSKSQAEKKQETTADSGSHSNGEQGQSSKKFDQYLDDLIREKAVPSEQKERFYALAREVYSQTRELVAPIYILLADKLLNRLKNEPDSLVLTLARDGLPIDTAAQCLIKKFDQFEEIDHERVKYLHYNGQFNPLVKGTTLDENFPMRYREYLAQLGVKDARKVILADSQSAVGLSFQGLTKLINEVNPKAEVEGEFIDIWPNGTKKTHGLLKEGSDPNFHLSVYKNRLQLVEALYSGVYNSATDIVLDEESGQYLPVITKKSPTESTAINGLSPESLILLNEVAIKGIEDATDDYPLIKALGPKDAVDKYVQFVAGEETEGIRLLKETIPWQRRAEEWYLCDQYWTEERKTKWAQRPDQIEMLREKYENPSLPDPDLHDPAKVTAFVQNYLERRGETPREIALQIIGVKTLQNPGLIERFLVDYEESRKASQYQGETELFLIDDSWDDVAARQIAEVAQKHGVDYYRVRDNAGFAQKFTRAYAEKIKNDPNLTDQQKKYQFWLGRALLKDRLQAPLVDNLEDFTFKNPLAELGGIAGTQNFGYLVAAYEAGKRGVPLNETTITINEDDQRYRTLAKDRHDSIKTERPDLLAERAAWFRDPETEATVGRYTGHTGNPISLVKDTLELSSRILSERNSGLSSTYDIFDPETGTFRQVSTEEAYQLLPQILQAATQRQPIAALWTKERHYREKMDWEEASKLDLGNISLTGESVKNTPTPLGGIFDYNFSGLLRARAVEAEDPNRIIRREEPLMHHRSVRKDGGDAFGSNIIGAFNNSYAQEQLKISFVIERDEKLQAEIMAVLGISPGDKESFKKSIRTFEANGKKLQEIRDLRQLFSNQVELARLANKEGPDQVIGVLEKFLDSFPEKAIDDVESDLLTPPSRQEIKRIRKGVHRYVQMSKIWPELIDSAYQMGIDERMANNAQEKVGQVEAKTAIRMEPVEVGYLPGVSAHTGRPLEVALELSKAGIPTSMRGSKKGRHIFDIGQGFETEAASVVVNDSDEYYYHPGELLKGEFSVEQMVANIDAIASRLEKDPPPFVLVDHNAPLLMAAKLAGVPTVAITNMSNVGFTSERFVKELGPEAERLAAKYYTKLDPKLREVYKQSYERHKGEPPADDPNWFQLMETGDLTIISDNEAFVGGDVQGLFNLDPTLRKLVGDGEVAYVGSIQPETIINQNVKAEATAEAVSRLQAARAEGRKVIFGSFGSIRDPKLFSALLEVAENKPETILMITTTDAELPANLPDNLIPVKFANLPELAKQADVLLCQGGSGTLYPFMKTGKGGIVTITTNADQQYNAALVEQHRLGINLPISELTGDKLSSGIDRLLLDQDGYSTRMAAISPQISLNGAEKAAEVIRKKFGL